MAEFVLKAGERLDDLQRGGLSIIQHPGRFCFGIDAVLLAEFARALPGEKVMDLCSGTGIIPILMTSRSAGAAYQALEVQAESADMAARSVLGNHLENLITVTCGDLKDVPTACNGRFDVVTVNPPYAKLPSGKANATDAKSIARHEVLCTLDDVLDCAARLLKSKGKLFICYRPTRLADLLCAMRERKLEPKRMRFVHPKKDSEPNIVLVEGIKDAASELRVLPPLVVYDDHQNYTAEIYRIYQGEA